MAFTVGDVVEGARGLHPAFDRYQNPDKPTLNAVRRWARRLLGDVARVNPRIVETSICDLDIPSFDFDDGEPIEDFKYYVDGWLITTSGDRRSFSLLTPEHRVAPEKFPSGYMSGNVLRLFGDEINWEQFKTLNVEFLSDLSTLTGLDSDINLPLEAEDAMVYGTAYYFAKRARASSSGPRVNVSEYRSDMRDARDDFIQDISNRRTSSVGHVREVW